MSSFINKIMRIVVAYYLLANHKEAGMQGGWNEDRESSHLN